MYLLQYIVVLYTRLDEINMFMYEKFNADNHFVIIYVSGVFLKQCNNSIFLYLRLTCALFKKNKQLVSGRCFEACANLYLFI